MKEVKIKYVTLSIKSMKKSIRYLNFKNKKTEQNVKEVDTAVRNYSDVYFKQLEIEQLNTGSIMKGSTSIDLNLCNGINKS